MVIRRREKPLTPKEAIEQAKKELFPFWFGSEPLLAAVQTGNDAKVFPLDSAFALRPWLLVFVDPATLTAADAFEYARAYSQRYEPQRLGVMTVLKTSYSYIGADWARKWANARIGTAPSPSFMIVLDASGLMGRAFQIKEYPSLVLMNQGNVFFNRQGKLWFDGTEAEIQRFFRSTDPGLPLYPPMLATSPLTANAGSHEFVQTSEAFQFSGKWTRDGDRMVTRDPAATVTFQSPGCKLGLVAQAVQKTDAPISTEAVLELNSEFNKTVVVGPDLRIDARAYESVAADRSDKCRATLPLAEPKLYSIFEDLPITHREVTLHFPNAAHVGVALYSVRFGN
jgi:hypothetical protein